MAAFSAELTAAIRANEAGVRVLVALAFASATMRVHTGFGDLVAGAQTWSGVGDLVSISGLEQTTQGEAGQATFTVSGVSATLIASAQSESGAEYRQRPITVYLQFFDVATDAAIGSPVAIWTGLMDNMRIARSNGDDGPVRTITLTAETLFQDRARPSYGSYSDSDQKARFAGDKGCERVAGLVDTVVKWPVN